MWKKTVSLYRSCDSGGDGVAKVGRPKVENPRAETMYLRLTAQEKDTLEKYASKHGLNKTQVVVKGIQALIDADEKNNNSAAG